MATKNSRTNYMLDYAKNNLKRVPLDLQKEQYERVKNHATGRGETVNGFIKRAIDETMDRDNGES